MYETLNGKESFYDWLAQCVYFCSWFWCYSGVGTHTCIFIHTCYYICNQNLKKIYETDALRCLSFKCDTKDLAFPRSSYVFLCKTGVSLFWKRKSPLHCNSWSIKTPITLGISKKLLQLCCQFHSNPCWFCCAADHGLFCLSNSYFYGDTFVHYVSSKRFFVVPSALSSKAEEVIFGKWKTWCYCSRLANKSPLVPSREGSVKAMSCSLADSAAAATATVAVTFAKSESPNNPESCHNIQTMVIDSICGKLFFQAFHGSFVTMAF